MVNTQDSTATPAENKRLSLGLFVRLSTMMALQYAPWGAWIPILYFFLRDGREFTNDQIANIFVVGAIGIMAAPFAGQCVDRYISTEKFLGISHLIGAVVVWQLSWIDGYFEFLILSLVYAMVYGPTIALTNSLAFHHLPDRERHFGIVRVMGGAGYIPTGIIVAQWLFFAYSPEPPAVVDMLVKEGVVQESQREKLLTERHVTTATTGTIVGNVIGENERELVLETTAGQQTILKAGAKIRYADVIERRKEKALALGMADGFKFSALFGLLMGLFCFTLPNTPPRKGSGEKYAFLKAARAMGRQPLLTLCIVSVPLSCVHQFYFVHTGRFIGTFDFQTDWVYRIFGAGGGGMMTLGQVCETIVMATIAFYVARFSRKALLLAGIAAYAIRFACFSYAREIEDATGIPATASIIAGLLLHGPCFTWFWFLGFMIVDEETTEDVRGSAQSIYNLILMGIGGILGSKIAGWIADAYTLADDEIDYTGLFSWALWGSVACFVGLAIFYPGGKNSRERES